MTEAELLPSAARLRVSTLEAIEEVVSEAFRITRADLRMPGRQPKVAWPRMVAEYFSREMAGASLSAVSERFGQVDHSSVIYAVRKVRNMMEAYPKLRKELDVIRAEIEKRAGEKP